MAKSSTERSGWLLRLSHMRTTFYIVILARKYGEISDEKPKQPPVVDISKAPFSAELLAQKGVSVSDIGYHGFSPDGSYFFFAAPGKAYLIDVSSGDVSELPGLPLRGFEDNRLLALFKGDDIILYNPKTKNEDRIKTDGNIYAGALSPDGTMYVFNAVDGISLYDLKTKVTTKISGSSYDGADVWFKDNTRMLGYKETGENLFEAGKGRVFGIWNIKERTFEPFEKDKITQKSIRSVFWIIPEHVARVNAGWDDGSFDYLVDIDTGTVLSLGDTSAALMGGMDEDSERGFFALVRSDGEAAEPTAELYKGTELKKKVTLPSSYFREGAQIVDDNRLLYIRKYFNQTTKTIDRAELVVLDLTTASETVLRSVSARAYARVSLAPDYKTWVLSTGKDFYTGVLE
jgi:hypothetical protein